MDYLRLLSGDPHTFTNQVWGRRVLIHEVPPAELAGIFDLDQADHLITQTAIRTPQIRLAQSGSVLPESRYTRHATTAGRTLSGLIDPRKVLDLFSGGATIVFQGLQRYWEPLRLLVRDLEEQLGHPCQANAYLTPPGSQGFSLHSDSHDVFVFQTYGRKDWEVHQDGQPQQVAMVPGTSMYLPTGTPHMARTQDTASLHVTVGINRYVWRDLVRRAVEPLLDADELNEPLPAGAFTDPSALAQSLRQKLLTAADRLNDSDAERIVERFERNFATGRQPVLGGGLMDRLEPIEADTRLWRREGSTLTIRDEGEELLLLLGDRSMRAPARARQALEWIAQADSFTASEVPTDEQSALVLARRLVKEGVLSLQRTGQQ